jgi:response regulator RpfG family c-di-GMP phosphodiesterase
MKKIIAVITVFLLFSASSIHAQRDDGILMEVQEVNIAKMKAGKMSGAEAVMKVMEQYTDGQYRFAFISNNYLATAQQQKFLNVGRDRFLIAVAGYPAQNNLVYTQVFFDNSFFFIALTKRETEMKRTNDMQIIRVNYEKGNAVRRNNVRDTIQRNNIIPLGIDTIER